jgi:FkbH-like protein
MPLRLGHLAARRLGVEDKPAALRSLAQELRLGLESFILVDDDPLECLRVAEECPEVVCLPLPREPSEIPPFLDHVWALDVATPSAPRTAQYRQAAERERARERSSTLEDFLASLELKVQLSPALAEHAERISELSWRVNQLNVGSPRRSAAEVARACGERLEGRVVHVQDRFGDYGLVGCVLFAAHREALRVDTFLLSCRALGRRVEHRMLEALVELCRERGLLRVEIPFERTPRNGPALELLRSLAGVREGQDGAFILPVNP